LPIDFIGIKAHVDPILVKPTIEDFIKPKDLGQILFIIYLYDMQWNTHQISQGKRKKKKGGNVFQKMKHA